MLKKLFGHIVFKNFIALSIIKVMDFLLPLLTMPLIARKLSLEDNGLYFLILSVSYIGIIFTDFGFGISGAYNIAKNIEHRIKVNQYLSSVFFLKIFLSLFAILGVTLYLVISETPNINWFTYILISVLIISQTYQAYWFFQGIEKMKLVTWIILITKSSYLVLVYLIVYFVPTVNAVLFCLAVSNIVSAIAYIYLIYQSGYKLVSIEKQHTLLELKESFVYFLSVLTSSLSTSLNSLVINKYIGISAVANYGYAERLYNAGMSTLTPINSVLFPYMTRTKNYKILIKMSLLVLFISIIGCYLCAQNAEFLITLILGDKFTDSAPLLRLFMILAPINMISILYGYPAFAIIDRPKIPSYTVIFSALIFVLLLVYLILNKAVSVENIIYSVIFIDSITLINRLGIFFYFLRRQITTI